MGDWVCLGGDLQLGVFNVGVDLRRVQVLVPEDVLHRLDIHAAGEHHRRRRVAQLVGGVLAAVEPGGVQMLFDEVVDVYKRQGRAYVIHNGGQPKREEDYFARNDRVTAHYRFDPASLPDWLKLSWQAE